MYLAHLDGRLVLVSPDTLRAVDVERLSGGRFGPDPMTAYADWDAFRAFVATADIGAAPAVPLDQDRLGPPVPAPRQVFAIGLNYRDHAAEGGAEIPSEPMVFTKFPACLAGPRGTVVLPPGGNVDWEVELVAVIGREAYQVARADAWSYVAGLTVGQDISERITQLAGTPPQFSLGKSFPGFGPIGPWVVPVDAFGHGIDPGDLELACAVNGEEVQKGRTRDLVFDVPELVHRVSQITPMYPGDLVFTGTPAGVGLARTPQRWLVDGDELVSSIEGIGELRQRFVTA
ncbi:fumarylacetoacetate hydrolase family protein [Streptomyces sp. NPDC048290]|uniref:fumarylacetoacetate hydrolase family protein n=1 Tax=Streptomyces sp. NPDC048290 TaxID=3155811 RepID=UPI0034461192